MEPLFRFALVRPPIAQDPEHPSIDLTQESPFQIELSRALDGDDPRPGAIAVSRALIDSESFVGNVRGHPLAQELDRLASGLSVLEAAAETDHRAVAQLIEAVFGVPVEEVAVKAELTELLGRLRDSVVAIKHVQEEHSRPIQALTDRIRDIEVILTVAAVADFPQGNSALRRHRHRSASLPNRTELSSIVSSREIEEKRRRQHYAAERKRAQYTENLLNRFRNLRSAVDELTALDADDLRSTAVKENPAVPVPEELQPAPVLRYRADFGREVSTLTLKSLESTIGRDVAANDHGAGAAALVSAAATTDPVLLTGLPAFSPPKIADIGFRVAQNVAGRLSETTTSVLADRRIELAERPLDRIVEQLRTEVDGVRRELDGVFGGAARTSMKRIGSTLVVTSTPEATAWSDVLYAGGLQAALALRAPDARVPRTRGNVEPAGVADLLVVKQQLIAYESADVAHIENVLKGESKRRQHVRHDETEQVSFSESELTTTQERELQSTTRFEMSKETTTTLEEEASLKAGVSISGKYGPVVEFSASAEGAISRSKTEANKAASSFSQDVTERSVNKITERMLERTSFRVTNEVTETNEHNLDNKDGAEHISGVYQWVNKVYQAQMYNYGLRTMFDFMVPEPAALLIHVLQTAHASAVAITKPPTFSLQPNQVTESNYGHWVATYGATDVQPPPDVYTTVSATHNAGGGDAKTDYTYSTQLQIPTGYRAVQGTVGVAANEWQNDAATDFVLGRRSQRLGGGVRTWTTSLDDEHASIPLAVKTWRISDIAVAVEVKCQRTARAMQNWAADTHAKLTNAYRARLADYEEKLSALEIQAGVAIEGKNPGLNLELMNDELKKHCITILTDQHFDLFSAINPGYYGWPQMDIHEAAGEGPYVRFFEQAFEWEHMTWVPYPYFWGGKSRWDERISYEDPDPLFNQFLKSGFARVSVPARPGFEGAIDHFMSFGELWNGGPLPPVSSPLYLPIADEIAERLDRPGAELPQGDPWAVRVPTTLVKLRPDNRLPQWQQNEDGTWVEEGA